MTFFKMSVSNTFMFVSCKACIKHQVRGVGAGGGQGGRLPPHFSSRGGRAPPLFSQLPNIKQVKFS